MFTKKMVKALLNEVQSAGVAVYNKVAEWVEPEDWNRLLDSLKINTSTSASDGDGVGEGEDECDEPRVDEYDHLGI